MECFTYVEDNGSNEKVPGVNADGEEDSEDEDDEMKAMLGFSSFTTTKGQAVSDNLAGPASGAVAKHKARKYRQFMNIRRPTDGRKDGSGGDNAGNYSGGY